MKNINLTHLIILFIAPLLLTSCLRKVKDSNTPTFLKILFYDSSGKQLLGEEAAYKLGLDYLLDLKMKIIIPNDTTKNIERPYISDSNKVTVMNQTIVPVISNSLKEEFRYILLYKNQELYNSFLQLHYQNGTAFKYVVEANMKNNVGNWIPFTPKKIEIIKDGKNTGIFFEFNISI